MPRGVYEVAGVPEAFSCAPGPAGWRYVSDTLDLTCDAGFAVLRFTVRGASAAATGRRAVLDDGSALLSWSGPDEITRHSAVRAVDGVSPGHLVALCRLVSSPGAAPVTGAVAALLVRAPSFGGLLVRRRLARVGARAHQAPGGALLVETWHLDDPDTGERRVVHLAGDVVLAASGGADGDVELVDLESPPSPA